MDETDEIKTIQAAIKKKGAKWTAKETSLTRLSAEERKKWLGSLPEEEKGKEKESAEERVEPESKEAAGEGAAAAWDWRNANGGHDWTTPVKSQCGCGSCIAFGTLGAMECFLKILRNDHSINPDFSESHLFYCNSRQCFPGDPRYGWSRTPALDYLRDSGVPDEACFPYTCPAGNQACNTCSNWENRATKITSWKRLTSKNDMKNWLSTKGPLVTSFTVYDDFFGYAGGVYEYSTGGVAGGHCVTVVGYNDNDQCWICKNSWGSGWGESGYFRIKYGECGLDSSMDAIEGIGRRGWQNGKKILGLWAINENRNAWVYVEGLGWRKLASDYDNVIINLMTKAAHAKAENRSVDFFEEGVEGGTIIIREMYVW